MEISLNTNAEKHAELACKCPCFRDVNLSSIKSKVASMLGMIGRDGIFSEYTKHDIDHVNAMLFLTDIIIPAETSAIMTSAEWLLLVLATYFHDLGMLVTVSEYKNRNSFPQYVKYKADYLASKEATLSLNGLTEEEKEKFIYQEYVRSTHGERIFSWIQNEKLDSIPHDDKVISIVQGMVSGLSVLFKKDLATLCRSHMRDDLDNTEIYAPKQWYGQQNEERANVFYIALILRTADLLHITSDRTPTIEYRVISPANPRSQEEWVKQRAVASVQPKDKVDAEGNVDPNQHPDTFKINACFRSEEGFFSLIDYLNYARIQIQRNFQLNERTNKKMNTNYLYPWKDIDDSSIQTENFVREQLSFTIDQVRILDLLVGETLYNNHSVAIRELVQNAIDAVKLKRLECSDNNETYSPRIEIDWNPDSRELTICDNGTGMSMEIIKNHLLKVGSSRYRDSDFMKKHPNFHSISRFGIGLLTCFLVADDVDIITYMDSKESDQSLLLKIRNLQGKYLLKYGVENNSTLNLIGKTGTSIRLKIRPSIDSFNPLNQLRNWILFPGCEVLYREGETTVPIGFESPANMLSLFLSEQGSSDKYKVEEYCSEGIDMAILLKKNAILSEWELVDVDDIWLINRIDKGASFPCGLSIEGIRINYDTPGFDGHTFVAVANLYGANAPRTNVARSGVSSDSMDSLLRAIYNKMFEYLESQKKDISDSFSLTWANDDLRWLLSSLVSGGQYGSSGLTNKDLFKSELVNAPLVLVEENGDRLFSSYDDLKNRGHFWTIESESFSSINRLIREAHGPKMSSVSVMRAFLSDSERSLDEIDLLLCEPSFGNQLMTEVRDSIFEVSRLRAIENQRRLDMCWTVKKEDELWFRVDLSASSLRRYRLSDYYCFQIGEDVSFDVPEKYDVVKSRYGYFFKKDCCFSKVMYSINSVLKGISSKGCHDVLSSYCAYVQYLLGRVYSKDSSNHTFEQFLERQEIRLGDEVINALPISAINGLAEEVFTVYDPTKWYRQRQ